MSELIDKQQPQPSLWNVLKTWLQTKLNKNNIKSEGIKTENWIKRHWHLFYVIPIFYFFYWYSLNEIEINNNQSLKISTQQEKLIDSVTHNIKLNDIDSFNELASKQTAVNAKTETDTLQKNVLKVLLCSLLALFLTYFISYLFTAFNFLKAAAEADTTSIVVLIVLYSIFFVGFLFSVLK